MAKWRIEKLIAGSEGEIARYHLFCCQNNYDSLTNFAGVQSHINHIKNQFQFSRNKIHIIKYNILLNWKAFSPWNAQFRIDTQAFVKFKSININYFTES